MDMFDDLFIDYTAPMRDTLTITQPDDWHVHLRQGAMLAGAAAHTAARFGRAMVMPNLSPPVTTVAQALAYRAEIIAATPAGSAFVPLMSLYLTDQTPLAEVAAAARQAHIIAFKLYPAGATTHSARGVTHLNKVMAVLERMATHGLVLQIHAESTDPAVDVYDREAVYIEQTLAPLHREIPELKIVLEHVTTAQGVHFVQHAGAGVAATITAHHLMFNRNEMFRGGLRPHAYCLPVLKRERHRLALLAAATGGDPKFFLGTDSAPHSRRAKESACGCAGIYSAHAAVELYAEVFAQQQALHKLEAFASHHGADFYGVARNTRKITVQKRPWRVESTYAAGDGDEIVPLRAGEEVGWAVTDLR